MKELPDLALYRLFEHLDLADRMSCRLVTKRFLLLIDQLAIHGAIQFTRSKFALRWFDNFQAISPRNTILLSARIQRLNKRDRWKFGPHRQFDDFQTMNQRNHPAVGRLSTIPAEPADQSLLL